MNWFAEIRASDIGTRAGLFEVQKIGDEFFTFIVDCDKPKACSIVLRGPSKVQLSATPLCNVMCLQTASHLSVQRRPSDSAQLVVITSDSPVCVCSRPV